MASEIRPNIDSREGFEYDVPVGCCPECMCDWDECTCTDWDEYAEWEDGLSDEYDGQPDEWTEWQDLYGGDDWDHGQYDCYDEY